MKRVIAWVLILTLCLGLFAGCKKNKTPTDGDVTSNVAELEAALEYVKTVYKNVSEKTPKDYQRIGNVPVNGKNYEVVWSVNVEETYIKVIKGTDGMVTIDVNEEVTEDVQYVLTATISNDAGNSVSHSWNHLLPAASGDMISIVNDAYALKSGESMDYEVTLTGVITAINTPWSDDYKNITVTIAVAGAEDKPIQCYRLTGEGAKDLRIGDTITVTGTLKNYNGTVEFDAGCTLDAVIKGEEIKAPSDPKKIVDEAYALGANKSLPYEATLTGTITAIGTAYSDQYKNITVTMVVAGRESKPIVCYRLKGTGVDKIGINDEITVKGYITNYVGDKGKSTVEFTAGCQLLSWVDRAAPQAPSDPTKIVDEAYALGANQSLKYEATLTGKITKVNEAYDASHDNVTVTMVVAGRENKPIVCYRMKGTGADKIDIGDTITVKGYITNYVGDKGNSTVEFNYPTLVSYKKNTATAPTDDVAIVKAAYALKAGEQLPYKATLTGKITAVNKAYDAGYGNITITIVVEGAEDMPIKCFRLKGTGVDKIGVGDTVTVSGYIENYQHSSGDTEVEFTSGCTLDSWQDTGTDPEPDPGTDPDGTVLTVKEAVTKGASMEHNTYTSVKYKVTGEIAEVYDTTYGNMRIKDAEGNILTIYGTWSSDGTTRYDAMATKPVAGDTVTIYGPVGQYGGTAQIKNGWIVAHTPAGTDPTPDPEPEPEPEPAATATLLTEKPVADDVIVIYNSGNAMTATASGKKLAGVAATVTDNTLPLADEMAKLTVSVEGEYYIFTLDGKYLTSADTGNGLSFSDTLTDCGKWTITAADTGTWYLKNVGANYNGNYNQAMEYYNGFTTYGEKQTDIYKMQLYKVDTAPVIPEPEPATTATLLTEKPVAEDVIVIYNSGNAMTATASGKKLAGVAATVTDNILPLADEMAKLTVSVEGEYYIFTLDGKYLTSADTGNGLSFSDTLTDCGKWTITAADTGTWYLKNVGANYNGNYNQAMEYYNGFTTYGEKQTDIYKMQLYKVDTAPVIPEPATDAALLTEKPVAGDVIVIYNSGNAMTATASGKKLAGVAATVTDNILPLADEMAKLTVSVEGDYYIFTLDGKYLTSADTGNGLSFADTLTDCGKWTITAADTGTWYLKNVGANYNGNYNQAMEYYSGFTTYGEKQTDIYKMQLYKVGGTAPVIPEPEPEPPTYSFTYDFGTFAGTSVQYADETHDLGNGVTLNIKNCHINGQLRIYSSATNNGVATISSERAITAIKLNAGNKADVLNVYASADGNTWTLIRGISVTAAYADHVVELPEDAEYKYLQLDVEGSQQIRVKTIEFTLSPVVQYTYGSTSTYSNVILNWGERGTDATFLSPNAEAFYVKKGVTYDALAALSGDATVAEVPSSALYLALQELMTEAHKKTTSYGETRYLYCLTDCQNADSTAGISAFYSGNTIGPEWDGSTWNREHCWPKSKTTTSSVGNSTRGECGDIMTLRPVVSNNNSSRGNKAYGESAGFYNPNAVSNNAYDLRGDVARIVLYTYVRWGNTDYMWGSDGVMESKEILLDWIEADPVDTWELGRNDSVESVTGTRNVFVDYPELAFVLFGEEIPANMATPSGEAAA